MKLHIGVGLEPVLVLQLSARKGRGDAFHEAEKLDAGTEF